MLDKDKIVKERIINNEYPKIEIHKIDHSKLLVMLYSHIPFVLTDINIAKESELLDFIRANRMQYIKLSCAWKDMRIKGYKAMKANRGVLYLIAFAEHAVRDEDRLQKIMPVIAEMIGKELIRSSYMILYRAEAKDKPDMSIRYDVYDMKADVMPINDKHLIYSASIYNLYLRDALKHLIDEYISVSHDMQTLEKGEFGEHDEIRLNVDGHYYAYIRILSSLFSFVGGVFPSNMIPLTFYNIKNKW